MRNNKRRKRESLCIPEKELELHRAAICDNVKNLRHLLATSNVDINDKDWLGRTPLHRAAEYNLIQNVEWLLFHGADPQATNNHGQTPAEIVAFQYGGLPERNLIRLDIIRCLFIQMFRIREKEILERQKEYDEKKIESH